MCLHAAVRRWVRSELQYSHLSLTKRESCSNRVAISISSELTRLFLFGGGAAEKKVTRRAPSCLISRLNGRKKKLPPIQGGIE